MVYLSSPSQEFLFILAFFYETKDGDFSKNFLVKKPTLVNTSENEEPSDSIGIIIAVIIDVNY